MEFKCSCHGSGVNSFTGKCGRCGMTKESTIEKMKIPTLINNLKISILSLDRYSEVYERGTGVLENKDGEYVKLEEVLNLFPQKTVKRKLIKLEY